MWSAFIISMGEPQQAHTPAYCHCVTITTSTQHQQQYALFMPGWFRFTLMEHAEEKPHLNR
ncbi:hypothetical protein AI2623V1_2772 [Klebsiella oxytoca]|nr:hypothetical protein HMPREF9689_02090 [Klebsiella oxytoca 10-5245]CAF1983455.1 hypothetical protein AI2623V1_2772 [Klebsiella oxytoca]CAH5123468.1 hypothetical protein AI2623V1_2772 [Klebsiella oxytoca]